MTPRFEAGLSSLLVLALATLAGACTTLAPLELPPDGGGCARDDACKGDRICVQGRCVDPGQASDDGGIDAGPDAGFVDGGVDGGSVDAGSDGGTLDGGSGDGGTGNPPAPGELGGACDPMTRCVDPGAVCVRDLPGGYCAIPGCNGCPAQGACILTDAGDQVCVRACASDADCRAGYMCTSWQGADVCLPSQGGGTTPVGGPCATNADCAGIPSYCIDQWPGGYCVHGDCDNCPDGSACIRGRDFAACLATCQSNAECRDQYACVFYQGNQVCFYGG